MSKNFYLIILLYFSVSVCSHDFLCHMTFHCGNCVRCLGRVETLSIRVRQNDRIVKAAFTPTLSVNHPDALKAQALDMCTFLRQTRESVFKLSAKSLRRILSSPNNVFSFFLSQSDLWKVNAVRHCLFHQ